MHILLTSRKTDLCAARITFIFGKWFKRGICHFIAHGLNLVSYPLFLRPMCHVMYAREAREVYSDKEQVRVFFFVSAGAAEDDR